MDFDDAARTLYAVPPQHFVARRGALVADALREGNKSTAAALKQLRRPTAGAWLANLLTSERSAQIDALLVLGAQLRQAQRELSGPERRRLAQQRHEVIRALVADAGLLAREAGQPANAQSARELEQTLAAALADEGAADALRDGRLTASLRHTGFGALDASPAPNPNRPRVADEPPPTQGSRSNPDRRSERITAAEKVVSEARAALSTAEEDAAHWVAKEADLVDAQRERLDAVRELEDRLDVAREAEASVRRQLHDTQLARESAEVGLRDAKNRARDAERHLQRARGAQ